MNDLIQPTQYRLTAADGTAIQAVGEAEIQCEFGDIALSIRGIVSNDIEYVILGADFLAHNRVDLKFAAGVMSMHGRTFQLHAPTKPLGCHVIRVSLADTSTAGIPDGSIWRTESESDVVAVCSAPGVKEPQPVVKYPNSHVTRTLPPMGLLGKLSEEEPVVGSATFDWSETVHVSRTTQPYQSGRCEIHTSGVTLFGAGDDQYSGILAPGIDAPEPRRGGHRYRLPPAC